MNNPKGNNMAKMLNHNKLNSPKLNISSTSIQPTFNKQNIKSSSIPRTASNTTVADTKRKTSSTLNNSQRSDNKNISPSTSRTPLADNAQAANTIALLTNDFISDNAQALITHTFNTTSNNNIDKEKNFATAAASEKIPSREQAIVFNSVDGVPQIEYILAIGKIVHPKNIKFVSRISNNRFCIFLSNKQILDNLMLTTKHININDHLIPIRRLINPAKRFIISNVCPSIPNQTIIDALKNIDINPISHINHLKAGIKIEGYEHIMSFRRQMFLNHEDVHKLPNSLLINVNENQFRIFFTDDQITCFVYSSIGHITSNCKKNNEVNSKNDPIEFNEMNTHDTTSDTLTEESPPSTTSDATVNSLQCSALPIYASFDVNSSDRAELTDSPVDILTSSSPPPPPNDKQTKSSQEMIEHVSNTPKHNLTPISLNEKNKRPISKASLPLKSPVTTNLPTSPAATNKPIKKKAKINSRSNSFSKLDDTMLDNPIKPAEEIFINNNNHPLSLLQFQYVIENFSNNAINFHSLIIQWNINGFFKRSVDINRVLFELNPLILCFQETNLKNPQPPILKNYTGYIKNRTVANRASGGVATFIHKNIESKEVTIQTHLETIATLVELDRQTCICNIYIPDSTPFTSSDIKHIINQLPKPFIIMGDFNSRNTAWGCNITDSRGKIIEQIIEHEQSLVLLNNGDPARFNSFNVSLSAIDLTITSSNLVPSIEWQVLTSYSGKIRIQNKNTSYDPPLKWNLSKPNWKLFSELIEHDLLHNPIDLNANITQEHIGSIVNDFSNTILKAANIAIGIKLRNNKHKTTPWWNSECNNAIRKYKQALNRFKKTKDPDQNYSDEFLDFKNSYSSLPIDSPSTNEHCFNLPLNLSELLSVLQNSKSKSPGPDNNLRILGLIFDHKLSWKTHIKKLKTSCMGRMNIIKTLSNLSWGSDQNSLILIYKSLILSLMNYGSVIYGTAKANTLSLLDPIHN
ncbi:hypothetical protein AGLY_009206 [Aphis glycines]|uniref:Endonuclease/exonuclease/phosphatase domain-containing protein n=1 Tax=Aphis glycines TaxID=307491 RepID=A0A6G0TJI5_APHGL|nr:hypothetical protein AGLY_009206 [Aphis glycines]